MSEEVSFRFIDLDAERRRSALLHEVLGGEKPWFPLMGCRPVSAGCEHCVGLKLQNDWLARNGRPASPTLLPPWVQTSELARVSGFSREDHVVVAPGSDLFDEGVSDDQRDQIIHAIESRPDVLFYWFTKHADRQRDYLLALAAYPHAPGEPLRPRWPLQNVRIGVSVEDAASYRERAPYLFETPAVFRILRFEPLLEPIDVEKIELWSGDLLWPLRGIVQAYGGTDADGERFWLPIDEPLTYTPRPDLIVIGGERAAVARPPHPMWIRQIEKIAKAWAVPVFFRGWGSLHPVLKPDRERDASLVIVSVDGLRRGKGLGSATNFLATQSGIGGDVCFTRPASDLDPALTQYPGGKLDARPEWFAPSQKQRITDVSSAARDLAKLHARERYRLLQSERMKQEQASVDDTQKVALGQRLREILTTPISELPERIRGRDE
ncbi:DUF5131 family protein [Solimonas marina]|uniref:DUF5131 family protein n=1 Tax=Solimonas marina TaxID=2714601 RepID=A0A969WG91_9GAMM|nr:DUF5131 family protein [Solimonas marina]NKF24135.1 DUF5131 family protein [Solimonas marina]